MNQKTVTNSDTYVAQLYDLYQKGKAACSVLLVEIHRLAENVNSDNEMIVWPDEDRRLFEKTFKRLDGFSSEWYGSVMTILNQIPLVSLRAQFSMEVKIVDGELRALYPQLAQTSSMRVLLRTYDKFKTGVERLPHILETYEQFLRDFDSSPKTVKRKNVVYRLSYDEITGVIYINGAAVHQCNIDSELDKAITRALKIPSKKIVVHGNLRASISHTKIPKALQKLMFKTGKTVFKINPEITMDSLEKANINRTSIDVELQQLL